MRRTSLVVRCCVLALSLTHFIIVVCLFTPFLGSSHEALWQTFFPRNEPFVYHQPSLGLMIGLLLAPLALPLFAVWSAIRFPRKQFRLMEVGSCLPLLLIAWCFWAGLFFSPFQPLPSRGSFVPPLGFALSFVLMFILTIFLPQYRGTEASMSTLNQLNRLAPSLNEHARFSHPSEGGTRSERAGLGRSRPGSLLLILFGLLSYLLFFLSLAFSYTDGSGPDGSFQITGWQLTGEWLGVAVLVILVLAFFGFFLVFGLFPSLAVTVQNSTLPAKFLMLIQFLNVVGLLCWTIMLEYTLAFPIGDLHWPDTSVDTAFAIPPLAFLLAFVCSSILLDQVSQRQRG